MSTGISQKSITAVYFYNITLRIFMSQAFYTYTNYRYIFGATPLRRAIE